MNPTIQARKDKQQQRKAQRLQDVADRRHDAEVQARIKRQQNLYYYKVDNCWYRTEKQIKDFARWYQEYFGLKDGTLQGAVFRRDFGDNPPVAFDVDRVGY